MFDPALKPHDGLSYVQGPQDDAILDCSIPDLLEQTTSSCA